MKTVTNRRMFVLCEQIENQLSLDRKKNHKHNYESMNTETDILNIHSSLLYQLQPMPPINCEVSKKLLFCQKLIVLSLQKYLK